ADNGDPLVIVHYMQVGVLTVSPAVVLEDAVDVVRDLDSAALLARQLLHALASGVVEILHVEGGLRAVGLGSERLQAIGVTPVEMARRALAHLVATRVVADAVARLTDGERAEAIAPGLPHKIAGEAARGVRVVEPHETAGPVVAVALDVGSRSRHVAA